MNKITKIMLIIALIICGTTFISCNNEEKEEITSNIYNKVINVDNPFNF